MDARDQPLVSVVIPTRNAGPQFLRLLQIIHSQRVPREIEVVVIDSMSKDGTPDLARSFGASVLSIQKNCFNHGRARNWAIRKSAGEFVALTVQDALPTDEHWLSNLLDPLLQDSLVAGSYGLQEAPTSAGLLERACSLLWRGQNQHPLVKSLETPAAFDEMSPPQRLELIRFDNVTSCVRRTVWQELPFPERNYGEDIAWAKRALLEGLRLAYVPAARVWHYHERGWMYQLRRAYLDGYARAELVEWPAPGLSFRAALGLLRALISLIRNKTFDAMVEPSTIQKYLERESIRCESLGLKGLTKPYCDGLAFSQALLRRALTISDGERLPEGSWANLLRFSMVGAVGRSLGATGRTKLNSGTFIERIEWSLLHQLLSRGV